MIDLEKEQKEFDTLKHNSPATLPDNPTQAGWTSSQIKDKLSKGLFYLYSLIKGDRRKVSDKFEEVAKTIGENQTDIEKKLESKVETTRVEQLETKVAYLQDHLKETHEFKTKSLIVGDTLVLTGATVVGDTLVLSGCSIEDDTLLI